MKKKIFYCAFNDVSNHKDSGVAKKVKFQIKALQKNKFNVYYSFFNKNIIEFNTGKRVEFNNKVQKKVLKYHIIIDFIEEVEPDIIYIRYPLSDIWFINFLKKIKKKNNKILIEIPTYPYDYEFKKLPFFSFTRITVLMDRLLRRRLKKYVDKIITFSDKNSIFGTETINISNGIDLSNIPLAKTEHNKNRDTVNLISVSSLLYWHGIDRLLKSMKSYYENNQNYKKLDILLNVVGDGQEMEYLKKLTKIYDLEKQVIFHGYKSGEKLDQIYLNSDIGVGCLGNFRKNIDKVKALKNTEYAARGLPMFYSEINTDFDDKPFSYKVSHDESIIDLNKLIEFYYELQCSPLEIRKYVENNLTWKQQFKKVIKGI